MKEESYANRKPTYPEVGERFGSWKFLGPGKGYRWRMRCACGTEREIRSQDVRQGASKSCGCAAANGVLQAGKANLTHGIDYGSKLYRTWRSAKNRCFNPNADKYLSYGGAGITMHPEWAASFPAFAAGVGEPPSPKHTIDRIDNEKNYEPGNVKWSTAKEQANNTSSNVRLTLHGTTKTQTQWAEEVGMSTNTIRNRLRKGWTVEKL